MSPCRGQGSPAKHDCRTLTHTQSHRTAHALTHAHSLYQTHSPRHTLTRGWSHTQQATRTHTHAHTHTPRKIFILRDRLMKFWGLAGLKSAGGGGRGRQVRGPGEELRLPSGLKAAGWQSPSWLGEAGLLSLPPSPDEMESTDLWEASVLCGNPLISMLIPSKKTPHRNIKIRFDQTSGHHGRARLTHKIDRNALTWWGPCLPALLLAFCPRVQPC